MQKSGIYVHEKVLTQLGLSKGCYLVLRVRQKMCPKPFMSIYRKMEHFRSYIALQVIYKYAP